jgi:GNAT superfamily N-acetyltransferase
MRPMIEPKLIDIEQPSHEQRDEIFRLLVNYNTSKIGPAVVEPLAIVLQGPESDAIIGGLWGESYYDWLFINFLIVPDEFRKRGVGTALMKRAEEIATNRGCLGIRLDTFSFQAPAFYEKLGYRTFGRLVNHPKGHERIYYSKELSHPDRR